jgi:hypothetical protein
MVEEQHRDLLAGLGQHPGRRIPSLNALRAFESVARLGTCTRAAEELHVTPAAVSQQIRYLEDLAGTPLFLRINREFVLTDAGRRCLPEVRKGFAHLAGAMQQIREAGRREHIAVCVAPAFAVRWLLRGCRVHRCAPGSRRRLSSLLPLHRRVAGRRASPATASSSGQRRHTVPVTDVAVCARRLRPAPVRAGRPAGTR